MGTLGGMAITTKTRALWADRVDAWRASGETAVQFVRGKGFEASTLRYYSSLLARAEQPTKAMETGPRRSRRKWDPQRPAVTPRFLRLVRKSGADSAAPEAGRTPALVVEVGAARVRVLAGFDEKLLAAVVRALDGVGQ